MAREYAAFISYRHKPLDIAVATRLHKCIERFRVPKDLRKEEKKNPGSVFSGWEGVPSERMLVFRDREELPLSNDLTSDIFDALDHARCLIVVCTPDTPKSLWVRREISHFIEKHGRKRIITVLAAGTPEESIPKEITALYAEDGVTVLEEYEPLVAYLVAPTQREVMKKLDKELLRVCAALLGCPYDSLKQRHKRRKMQQALAAAGAAFLVALSFIGVLVNRNLEIQAQKQEVEAQKLQVEAQKQEAEAQRRMVQLRESELLAADARAALDSGNIHLAIEKAISALPKPGEEDRPYYAPAESVLMEAMDVLGGSEENAVLGNTVLEQMTPVYNMEISKDGSTVVTIDKYGVLRGYDAVSGEELWSDIVDTDETSVYTSYIYIPQDDSCLISLYGETLEGRDLHDGRRLWSYDMDLAADGYFIYDDARNQIAILDAYFSGSEGASVLDLKIISAKTGQVEKTIPLERTEETIRGSIHEYTNPQRAAGGAFSEDGRYFACAFSREWVDEEKRVLMCFVADLQEGKLVRKFEKEIPYDSFVLTGMHFYEDGLVVALEPDDDTVAGSVLKLDWNTGKLLWQTTTPAELNEFLISNGRDSSVLFTDTVVILGKQEKLYAIDQQTGKILHSENFPGMLSALYATPAHYFCFVLRDGTCAVGVYNANSGFSLTTENVFDVTAAVGKHSLMQLYGGGIVQVYTDGQYIEISVSNVDRPGYVAVVPEENPNQIVIKRPVTIEKSVVPTAVVVPVEADSLRCTNSDHVTLADGSMILGQFRYYDEQDNPHHIYANVDTAAHQAQFELDLGNAYTLDEIHFLHDGSGYIFQDRDDVVTLIRNGTETVLAQKVDPHYSEEDQILARGTVVTDSVYLQDGTVLTVHSDTQSLTLFKDGTQTGTAALPDSHRYDTQMGYSIQRYVQAGQNGYVVTHLTKLMEPVSATDVAFYDTATGTWFQPELEAPFANPEAYAFAQNAPLFAAVDQHNKIRVLNLQSGAEETAFPLQLPDNSVLCVDFLMDDSCLMVKTRDAKVLIYEISTGQILLQDQLDTTYTGTLTAQVDPASQRLYIIDSSLCGVNALCVDLRSWTVLARAEHVLCYVPETNELLYAESSYGSEQPQFFCFRVPETDELVALGQQILEKG